MGATQNAHVPKFGNWDDDDTEYTTYFENASKGKGSATKMFNPNDPEENPDAFMPKDKTRKSESKFDDDDNDFPAKNQNNKKHNRREVGNFQRNAGPPEHQYSHNRINLDPHSSERRRRSSEYRQQRKTSDNISNNSGSSLNQRKSSDHKNNNSVSSLNQRESADRRSSYSESNGDMSNSDYSLIQTKHRRSRNKHSAGVTNGLPSSTFQSAQQDEIIHSRNASKPKFGVWDETDPNSAQGYTTIFSKVKEQKKQAAATQLPIVPNSSSNIMRSNRSASSLTKVFCCLYPNARR